MQPAIPQPYDLRSRLDADASIGLVALATDATIEKELRVLFDIEGVGFYVGRIGSSAEVNPDTLKTMGAGLTGALSVLLPDSHLDVIAYGCTSASLFIGEDQVAAAIRAVRPEAAVTTPLTAVKIAFSALESKRIAMLTPYIDAVNIPMAEHLGSAGFEVVRMGSFLNSKDPEVVRIRPESIKKACLNLVKNADIDTVFIACTALEGAALVPELEYLTGLSVTTSNHAMAWHALRLGGISGYFHERGRLFAS